MLSRMNWILNSCASVDKELEQDQSLALKLINYLINAYKTPTGISPMDTKLTSDQQAKNLQSYVEDKESVT